MFSGSRIASKVISEDMHAEATEETPAADTEQEMADGNQKRESTQGDSGTQNSTKKKKKKRKLNEAGEPTNMCEFSLRSQNRACNDDTRLGAH